jgi:hydrogenase-4 component D
VESTAILPLLPLLCACGAIIAGLVPRGARWTATAASGLVFLLGLLAIIDSFPRTVSVEWNALPWLPTPGTIGARLDPLSALLLFVVLGIGLLVVIFSAGYLNAGNHDHPTRGGQNRYYFWLLLFIAAMTGVVIAPNFLQLFIFWEITTLCSWALISFYDSPKALFAGYKALLMTHIGGLFLMTGIVLLYVRTHSFAFDALNALPPHALNIFFLLTLVGGLAKAAQGPFYTWLPDAMEAPTPVSAYLHAAAMVKAGIYLVARVVLSATEITRQMLANSGMATVVAVIAIATMVMGVYLFFFQDDLKKLLAFSTITHLSYMLVGCALGLWGSWAGFQGGILHLAAHAMGKALLFLSVGALAYFSGSKKISELSGVGAKLPLVGVAFFVGAFTVTGVPPFGGFFSKMTLIGGAFALGGIGSWIGVLLLAESVVAFAWFLWVGQKVFFGKLSPVAATIGTRSAPMWTALLCLMFLCLAVTMISLPMVRQIVQ